MFNIQAVDINYWRPTEHIIGNESSHICCQKVHCYKYVEWYSVSLVGTNMHGNTRFCFQFFSHFPFGFVYPLNLEWIGSILTKAGTILHKNCDWQHKNIELPATKVAWGSALWEYLMVTFVDQCGRINTKFMITMVHHLEHKRSLEILWSGSFPTCFWP